MPLIEIDGRTGEGGGQLVRTAVAIASLTTQAITITNIRGGRDRPGLKNQHVAAIEWLAEVTDADVNGLRVGSKTLTFKPKKSPSEVMQHQFKISSASGSSSALLMFQAVLPFLIFAGTSDGEPIQLEISGGTNTSFSPSFEFLDQVLLPTLEERFGIQVERELKQRGWSMGPQSRGSIFFRIQPLPVGQVLKFIPPPRYKHPGSYNVETVNVSMIIPEHSHDSLRDALVKDLGTLFPDAEVQFPLVKDSNMDSRWYVLLVGVSKDGIRWGKDCLLSLPKKEKARDKFVSNISRKLSQGLFDEASRAGHADEHLLDQLVCFQALGDGYSSFRQGLSSEDEEQGLVEATSQLHVGDVRLRKEKTGRPFGHGSTHAQTARWLVSMLLPTVHFFQGGDLVRGAGVSFAPAPA